MVLNFPVIVFCVSSCQKVPIRTGVGNCTRNTVKTNTLENLGCRKRRSSFIISQTMWSISAKDSWRKTGTQFSRNRLIFSKRVRQVLKAYLLEEPQECFCYGVNGSRLLVYDFIRNFKVQLITYG